MKRKAKKKVRVVKFTNKNGDLTSYAFACGYVQNFHGDNHYATIYMEHSHYHVQLFRHKPFERLNWVTFEQDELTKARKLYHHYIQSIKN
jgi:hypothetical protein